MRVSIVGIVGVPASYGGFETLVENLLSNGMANNNSVAVYCSSKSYTVRQKYYKGASLKYIDLNANGISSIAYDIISIFSAIKNRSDCILILGVSGAIVLPIIRLIQPKTKIVTNIDGLEWKRDKWSRLAKSFLKFSEKLAVKFSHVVITDNQAITDYVQDEYNKASVTIAYGGDHAVLDMPDSVESPVNFEYALSVCRIEPENSVGLILEAYSLTNKNIIFIGNWQNSEYGQELREKYSGFNNIHMLDPIYDVGLLYAYRSNASAYVHGHTAGGTNPSLVEMMHFSVPILAFDCCYNRETLKGQGTFFSNPDSLKEVINSNQEKCTKSILEVKSIANRFYTWEVIAKKYFSALGLN
ncbi:glycosyltransferase family 1 protein [Cobetia sp. cqz5-12]|uniref:DUF1972 domain-containing protein n=1 Tax=Cobetia sp. cqz5-12 TaxID=2609415 RepID=UPI00190550D4|nr:DUF1972 domain-containing protein [Cobetia sp. cqz5-12]QQK64610.1 glycosyltransferase family 1 protein [Cobetia sp. cqz5-12]